MANLVEKGVYYPLVDPAPVSAGPQKDVRGVWTGEYRPVKMGEWFLSGAVVEAYQALSDMRISRHIAQLVNVGDVHWVVTRDGVPVAVLDSENNAETWLLKHQGQSNDWAMRYEGYAITEVKP